MSSLDSASVIQTQAQRLMSSDRFLKAKADLLAAIRDASEQIQGVRPALSPEVSAAFKELLSSFQKDRGRELYFPFLGSGLGRGPYVELADGSVKMDLITGIGIHFFGHSHPALMDEMMMAAAAPTMQGNLEPGAEAAAASRALLARVGEKSRLKHAWLTCSGTMANEIALKIVRQKKAPATRILAFEDCFAGRSTAMQEITDNPAYRVGQPLYGEVAYLPYFSKKFGLERSIDLTVRHLEWETRRYPGRYAALMIELVQGEGGFNSAPREWYVKVFEAAKKAGLAVWADEVQSFGRTGELFAYQTFGLEEYVDIVTVGKLLQACATLFTEEYAPKPGLVAGTFTGSTAALRSARRVLEELDRGHLGPEGRIRKVGDRFREGLDRLAAGSCKGLIAQTRNVGAMVAFEPFGGTLEEVKAVLMKLFDLGVVAFYCGHGPYLIRMLPPAAAMTDGDVDTAISLIEQALLEVAKSRSTQTPAQGR